MNHAFGAVTLVLVVVASLAIGAFGLRISRTTSDFFVASRSVSPRLNASAISGEYLSAASFLGIAGLIMTDGADILWYSIGWTAGFLLLLVFVAAPLRRSGAYTVPDFARARLRSEGVRRTATLLVVAVGWLYLMPLFQGAGIVLRLVVGLPDWAGAALVCAIVVISVVAGGMRSITFVQAFQYWLKLTALLVPLLILLLVWSHDGPAPHWSADWSSPLTFDGGRGLYRTYSILTATLLGTMGLPHVVVRFYTNPDGHAARRTTLLVIGLLGGFYLLPTIYGVMGRSYLAHLSGRSDTALLRLPGAVVGGVAGDALAAVLSAGAIAAFLSTSSGVTMAIAAVVSQEVTSHQRRLVSPITALRVSALVVVIVPLALALTTEPIPVANSVVFAFTLAASTFAPLLVLGIWWRGLTAPGAIAGLVGGGLAAVAGPVTTLTSSPSGWTGLLFAQPALWSVPLGFALMVGVSLATRSRIPADVSRTMVRLHTPERIDLDRRY